MGKRLKSYVHVHDEDGETHVYGPEDDVPKAHAELIGDHAWVDDDEPLEDNRPGVVIDNAQPKPPRRPSNGGSGGSRAKAPSRRSRSSSSSSGGASSSSDGGKVDGSGGGASAGPDGSSSDS